MPGPAAALGPLAAWLIRTLGPLALRTTAGLVTTKLISNYIDPDSPPPPGLGYLSIDNQQLAERLGLTISKKRVSAALLHNLFILCSLRDSIDYMLAHDLLPRGARTWASHKARSLAYILRNVNVQDLAVGAQHAPPQHYFSDSQTQTTIQMLGFFPEAKSAYVLYWRQKSSVDAQKQLKTLYVAILRNLLTDKFHEKDRWRYYAILKSKNVTWLEVDFEHIADMMDSGLGVDDLNVPYSSMYAQLVGKVGKEKAKMALDAAAIAHTITDLACGVVWSPGLTNVAAGLLPSFSPSNSFMVSTVLNTAPTFLSASAPDARTVIEDKSYTNIGLNETGDSAKVRKGQKPVVDGRSDTDK